MREQISCPFIHADITIDDPLKWNGRKKRMKLKRQEKSRRKPKGSWDAGVGRGRSEEATEMMEEISKLTPSLNPVRILTTWKCKSLRVNWPILYSQPSISFGITDIYIYIYIYMCVCVCVCVNSAVVFPDIASNIKRWSYAYLESYQNGQ